MQTVELQLDDPVLEFVSSLGDVNEIARVALKRYATDEILRRIESLKRSIMKWESQYGMPYDRFHTQVIDAPAFLRQLHQASPMWEVDVLEWASQQQEFDQWMKQLESILKS